MVMAIDIVDATPHRLTQGIIEDQEPGSLRTAYLLGSNSNFDSARGLRLSIDTDKVQLTLLREPRRQL